jgi:hypothetical protein
VRVGLGMKKHWRKESKYADIAAVWRLAIVYLKGNSEQSVKVRVWRGRLDY